VEEQELELGLKLFKVDIALAVIIISLTDGYI
jgi:hypothetical protein